MDNWVEIGLDKLIESLKKLKESKKKVNISVCVEPDVFEFVNFDGSGKRFTKYKRIISITDEDTIETEIKQRIW